LEINEKRHWFFHGDVFDASLEYAKWLAKLGAFGYDLLIMINSLVNWFLVKLGREKMSFSKKIKNSVKTAVSYISDFEQTAASHAIERGYEYVICGHIHQPEIKYLHTDKGDITYLNSGDWIENLTALEYTNNQWSIYTFEEKLVKEKKRKRKDEEAPTNLLDESPEVLAPATFPASLLDNLAAVKPVKLTI
ncbi:MAG: UDP-2,3-diacylglucosamine diphosphatase, partial [Bacteroidota bacterium]